MGNEKSAYSAVANQASYETQEFWDRPGRRLSIMDERLRL